MRIIVKTCAGREHLLPYLERHLPSRAEFCFDDTGAGAMGCFLKALELAGSDPCLHMEDDIVLTRDFESKVGEVVQAFPDAPIQFFSMRKADLTVGSRWEPGRTYLMNQCHYLPAGMGQSIYWHWHLWAEEKKAKHPNGTDALVQDYLASNRLRYWLHCPSLVDHRKVVSAIDPRRGKTNRQSFTFTDPIED